VVTLNPLILIVDSKMSTANLATLPAAAAISATDAEGKHEEQQEEGGDASPKQEEEKMECGHVTATPNVACEFQER
jgi:ribosomal protein L12E/L44/L45/RPP1/RPP2